MTPRTAALFLVLAGTLLWNVLALRADAPTLPPSPPSLPVLDVRCQAAAPDEEALRERARQLVLGARAHVARYAFEPAQALPALQALGAAAACAQEAGADAGPLRAEAAAFRRRVEADYRDRVLRVERALAADHLRSAQDDLAALAALLDGVEHPFAQRVRNLQAELADERAWTTSP